MFPDMQSRIKVPGSIEVLCQIAHAVKQDCVRPRMALKCIGMHSAGHIHSHGKLERSVNC